MAFVSLLDDSNSEKIRKSIFIFSSIIVFSLLYKLEITAPKSLFSSAEGSMVSVKITYESILKMLAVFQVYLLVRLIFSWRISKAKFKKFWIMDEFEDKEDKSDLLKELDDFKEFCKSNSFPEFITKDQLVTISEEINKNIKSASLSIRRVNGVISRSKKSWEELNSFIYENNRLLRTLISDKGLLTDEEQKKLLEDYPHIERTKPDSAEPKFDGDLYAISDQFIKKAKSIESTELRPGLKEMEETLDTIKPKIDSLLEEINKLESVKDRYKKFITVFPESNYKLAIDIKLSDLTKSKKIREIELDFFEFWFPASVGLVSLILCFAPYIASIDKVFRCLSYFLSR